MPFPRFADANVAIHFNANDEPWMLHSYVLALHSSWWKASLSERWNSDRQTSADVQFDRTYELRFDRDSTQGFLMREWSEDTVLLGDVNETPEQNQETLTEHDALRSDRRLQLKAHRMMLKAMYHVETEMALEWGAHAKDFLPVLAHIGQYYGCAEIIDARVDYFLRRHSEQVLSDCASSTLQMLELGIATRSIWVTLECFPYLIGASNDTYKPMLSRLKELGVAKLLKKKRAKMANKLKSIDLKLLSLMCEDITDEPPEDYQQMALGIWRQWIAEELRNGNGSKMEKSYASVYRKLDAGVDKSLNLVDAFGPALEEADDPESAARWLHGLFDQGKDIVRPIRKDCTKLQKKRSIRADLLSQTILDSELPWTVKT